MNILSNQPHRACGLMLIGTLWFVLAGCGSTALAPQLAHAPSARPCTASQLEGLVVFGGVATGHADDPVLLRDRGGAPCTLEGFADVRVVDAAGATLAEAVGDSGRGTSFGDSPVSPVVLEPGTPALHQGQAPHWTGASGQAWMNLEWFDCRQRQAARLLLDLPGGGGQLSLASPTAPSSPVCLTLGHGTDSGLLRGPVSASGSR